MIEKLVGGVSPVMGNASAEHSRSKVSRKSLTSRRYLLLPLMVICLFALVEGGVPSISWCHECPPPIYFNLNTVSANELTLVPGFGPRRAGLVVEERERGGPFSSPGDISTRVKGIGPVLVGRLGAFLQ